MIQTIVSRVSAPAPEAIPALLVKVTLLFTVGAIIAALLRHRSAAVRHFAWRLTLTGALALGVIAPLAPALSISIPTGSPTLERAASTTRAVMQAVQSVVAEPSDVVTTYSADAITVAAEPFESATPTLGPIQMTGIVWLAGVAAVLAWLAIGHLGLARLLRRAEPLEARHWRALVDEAATENEVYSTIRLYRSDAISAPMTWGAFRPVVLLPDDCGSWSIERRRAVLLHEAAHVARGDFTTQLIANLVCAAYWFHPAAWFAARRLRAESERACDDRVLASGEVPEDYASQLLDVARQSRALGLGSFVAVGMARRSHLEGRLLAILDESLPRRPLSFAARGIAVVALAIVLIPLGGVRLDLQASPVVQRLVTTTNIVEPVSADVVLAEAVVAEPVVAEPVVAEPVVAHAVTVEPIVAVAATTIVATATVPIRPIEAPAIATVAANAVADSMVERTVQASAGELLTLDLETGGSVELRGWDQSRVKVTAQLGGRDWEDAQVEIDRVDGGVRVRSFFEGRNRNRSTRLVFIITVPRRFDLRLSSAGGDLSIEDVEGTFRGQTGGGSITLNHVKGRSSLSTGGGNVDVTDAEMDGTVSTGGGTVRLSRVEGSLRGSSGGGPVIYVEGQGRGEGRSRGKGDLEGVTITSDRVSTARGRTAPAGRLFISKSGGAVDLVEAPNGAMIHTGGGNISVGRAEGTVEANTGGGSVQIGPVRGSVRAGTGAGEVRVTLAEARGEEQVVDITSGSGRVIIELPENFDGSFDLETAYTQSNRRTPHIETDWDLDRSETNSWDDREGTARRYIRAKGSVGRGRGRVTIRTVNGDIIVRRAGR